MTHALAAIHANTARRSSDVPPPRTPRARAMVGLALGSALLGIVSATSAAVASMQFIRDVQLRTLAPAHPHRTFHRPTLVPPTPQPAFAQPPLAHAEPEPVIEGAPSILADAGFNTHDPAYLVARARRLADAGADVTVVSLRIPLATFDHAVQSMMTGMGATRVVPLYRTGHPAGLRIVSADGPLFALAGIRDGDVLTALNGYALPTTDESTGHFDRVMDEHLVVAELVRDTHRVVLAISWPDEQQLRARDARVANGPVQNVIGAPRLQTNGAQGSAPQGRNRAQRSQQYGATTRRTRAGDGGV